MQTQSFSSDAQTTPEAAVAAANAMAGKSVPQGMIQKVANVSVVDLGGMFVATVIVALEPDPQAVVAEPDAPAEEAVKEEDGKTEGGEGDAEKSSNARDTYFIPAPSRDGDAGDFPAPAPDLNDTPAAPQTPIAQSMEQLPDPDHDLLNPEIPDTSLGPETLGDEAVALAEEMRDEFNDQPEDLLVISKDGISPEQQASNEAHNQKALDAEETRREAAINNAALAQDDLTPEPAA